MRQFCFTLSLLFTSFFSFAQATWQEDTHYKVIAKQASSQPKVQEIFSYWCPACNAFETLVPQIKANLAQDVSFEKIHVNFNGSTSKETQDAATAMMLSAKALKTETQFNKALFNAIHQKRTKINDQADLLKVYASTGADSKKLEKMLKSFGIRGQVAKNNKIAQAVRRVPTIIVNEKYQAIFTRDMKPEQYVELINWLVKQK